MKRIGNGPCNPNDREKASFLKENILPIEQSGQLKFIEQRDGVAFSEHMRVRLHYGHTDAMMLPEISYNGHTIIYMADLLPSAAHIPLPYVMAYDMFPLTTLEEKSASSPKRMSGNMYCTSSMIRRSNARTLVGTEKGIRLKESFPYQHCKSIL